MAPEKVVLTENELQAFDLDNPEIVELINFAKESDAADKKLTIGQALKKYKKAVFWAMLLSTSLIMEGYDLVIVSRSLCDFIPYDNARGKRRGADVSSPIDQLVLRPNAVPKPLRCLRQLSRTQPHHSGMAIWSLQLVTCWPAAWSSG